MQGTQRNSNSSQGTFNFLLLLLFFLFFSAFLKKKQKTKHETNKNTTLQKITVALLIATSQK